MCEEDGMSNRKIELMGNIQTAVAANIDARMNARRRGYASSKEA